MIYLLYTIVTTFPIGVVLPGCTIVLVLIDLQFLAIVFFGLFQKCRFPFLNLKISHRYCENLRVDP